MKKFIWIIAFVFVCVIGIYILIDSTKTKTLSKNNTESTNRVAIPTENQEKTKNTTKDTSKLTIGDEYFITQLNDIYYNMNDYEGRAIEIEGFPLSTSQYTFVSRYGPGCCSGDEYAYVEYKYDKELELTDEKDWIKVVGTIKKANDGIMDYIYIEATSVEKMKTRGIDRVTT